MTTWRERIVEARQREGFSPEDREAAACWGTCAVGEQHAAMPDVVVYRDANAMDHAWLVGGPVDRQLLGLGARLPLAIGFNDFDGAGRLLDAIEDRALQLKREQ